MFLNSFHARRVRESLSESRSLAKNPSEASDPNYDLRLRWADAGVYCNRKLATSDVKSSFSPRSPPLPFPPSPSLLSQSLPLSFLPLSHSPDNEPTAAEAPQHPLWVADDSFIKGSPHAERARHGQVDPVAKDT